MEGLWDRAIVDKCYGQENYGRKPGRRLVFSSRNSSNCLVDSSTAGWWGMTCWKEYPLRRQRLVRSITWATRIQWQWPTWLSVLSFLSENTETSTRQGWWFGGKVENTWPNWVSCVSYGKNIAIQVFEEPPDTTRNASRNAWLQRRLRRAIGKKAIKNYVPMPPTGDVLKTSADVSLATRRKAQLVNVKADKKTWW